jgi:hypothetical protein
MYVSKHPMWWDEIFFREELNTSLMHIQVGILSPGDFQKKIYKVILHYDFKSLC